MQCLKVDLGPMRGLCKGQAEAGPENDFAQLSVSVQSMGSGSSCVESSLLLTSLCNDHTSEPFIAPMEGSLVTGREQSFL